MDETFSLKITSFTKLIAWKEAHNLALIIYQISKDFPTIENFALTSQMRRCAISISSNIAEGFSRAGKREKIQFYFISKGSLTELQNQLILAKDVGYINEEKFKEIDEQINLTSRLIYGLIKSLRKS